MSVPSILELCHALPVRELVPGADGEFLQRHQEVAYSLLKLFAQRLYGLTNYLGDVKRQFEHHDSQLAMVHDVLETLVHHPQHSVTPASDRDSGV